MKSIIIIFAICALGFISLNSLAQNYVSKKSSYQLFVDRPGNDYYYFRTDSSVNCMHACLSTNRCKAWVYVKPGYGVDGGQCKLKDKIPRAFYKRDCCASGVIQPQLYI